MADQKNAIAAVLYKVTTKKKLALGWVGSPGNCSLVGTF